MTFIKPTTWLRSAGLGALVFTALGCGVFRPTDFEPVCADYETAIRPVLAAQCAECHQEGVAMGAYVTGDYAQTVSRSQDGAPRIEPGDVNSPLLVAARGESPGHRSIPPKAYSTLKDWVIACRAAPKAYDYHPKGWGTPTDRDQFHGAAMRDAGYNYVECAQCHGGDQRGGKSGVACTDCHKGPSGAKACNTCHGDATSPAPPKALDGSKWTKSMGVGAHRTHLAQTPTHPDFECKKCHVDVRELEQEGHYRRDGGFFMGPAAVPFSSDLADGGALWDRATATCSNVACHAPNPSDTAAKLKNPKWTTVTGAPLPCDSCHGQPPSTHADNRCGVCHGKAYADGGVDSSMHFNGKVDVLGLDGRCDTCHAGPASASFFDTSKRGLDAGVQTVGAHDAHLKASRLRGPMECADCHVVPNTLKAAGHIDSAGPAEVFPTTLVFKGVAYADNAQPSYSATSATCGGGYCHGASAIMQGEADAGLLRAPSWTGGPEQAGCGTACHSLPPKDGKFGHAPTGPLTPACHECHGGTVAVDGGILFSTLPDGGRTSKHIDGKITGWQ